MITEQQIKETIEILPCKEGSNIIVSEDVYNLYFKYNIFTTELKDKYDMMFYWTHSLDGKDNYFEYHSSYNSVLNDGGKMMEFLTNEERTIKDIIE